jgi:hypothetical protein
MGSSVALAHGDGIVRLWVVTCLLDRLTLNHYVCIEVTHGAYA